jgi:hypothetical protein
MWDLVLIFTELKQIMEIWDMRLFGLGCAHPSFVSRIFLKHSTLTVEDHISIWIMWELKDNCLLCDDCNIVMLRNSVWISAINIKTLSHDSCDSYLDPERNQMCVCTIFLGPESKHEFQFALLNCTESWISIRSIELHNTSFICGVDLTWPYQAKKSGTDL